LTVRRPTRLPLELLAACLLEGRGELGLLDFPAVFGNHHAVELEVGFGKGLFLLTAAQVNPQINYLGIEVERKYQLFTANRLVKRGLGNVRLVCGDARDFVRDRVPGDALQAIHVYFPDPWWKKRHHKRRLFNEDFVGQMHRVLRAGGLVNLASDVEDYSKLITRLVSRHGGFAPTPSDEPGDPGVDGAALTNYARKYRQQGRAIWRASYRKVDTPG
jgi:tRNA (guanine-N7-)-methyltransferase